MSEKMKAEDLHLYYGEKEALKGINIYIDEKKIVSLIGPSGCGKSTFLRCLNRMNDLIKDCRIEGKIYYNNEDIYAPGCDTAQLRKNVGMVFQKPNPFPFSIFENIAYGPKTHGLKNKVKLQEKVEKALTEAGLWDEVKDRLNSSAMGLSGGQMQRLCIARALLKKPKILILDDSTSAVDTATDAKIREAFAKEIPNTTKLIIAQRVSSVQNADRIIVMDNGEISGFDSHENLIKTNEIYREVYESQTKGGGDFDENGGE